MINDEINNIPDKTIAIFPTQLDDGSWLEIEKIYNFLEPATPKREWFNSHFYRCLPLTIANSYGFIVKSGFDFSFEWNGGDSTDDIFFTFYQNDEELSKKYPRIDSHFGSGIITINPPFKLMTPPGVNLLTINPPNYFIPNITVMSGSVETDNIRRNFTFNLKIQIPNLKVFVPAGTPLAGFIPIPRYFADSFKLKNASELFDLSIIEEEEMAVKKANEIRINAQKNNKFGIDRDYYFGRDSFGNKFKDHQKP